MGFNNYSSQSYISQSEAAILAGVSAATLMRFAEAGYFRTLQQDGVTQFSRQEICDVFGPAISTASSAGTAESARNRSPETQEINLSDSESSPGMQAHQPAFQSNEKKEAGLNESKPLNEKIEKFSDNSTLEASQYAAGMDTTGARGIDITAESPELIQQSGPQPIDAFKRVLQLQEELLAQKELKIQDLIKEREWLRSRLEKMEDKSDRDQMLLMVESQKVRTLIDKSSPKPGIMRLALDWLGGAGNKVNDQQAIGSASKADKIPTS